MSITTYLQVIASLPLSNKGGVPERSGRLITATPRQPTRAMQLPLLFFSSCSTSHTGGRERANVWGDNFKWSETLSQYMYFHIHCCTWTGFTSIYWYALGLRAKAEGMSIGDRCSLAYASNWFLLSYIQVVIGHSNRNAQMKKYQETSSHLHSSFIIWMCNTANFSVFSP